MTLSRYEIFCKVVELGSLTRAAKDLNMTQSAVSHAINNFEKEVGLPLLIREKNGVQLTTVGQELYPYILGVLNKNERLKQHVSLIKGIEAGTLRIAIFSSIARLWMPSLLSMFHEKYPNIEVKLHIGYYQEIYDMIKTGLVDFGFLPKTVSDALYFTPLVEDPLLVIAEKNHPIGQHRQVPLESLLDEPFILPKWGLNHDAEKIISEHKLKLNIRYEIKEDHTLVAMVEQGLGLSIFPKLTLENLCDNIEKVPLAGNYKRIIGISHSTSELSPVAKQFIGMTESWLQTNFTSFRTN